MTDPFEAEVEKQLKPFTEKNSYSKERLNALNVESFTRKWKVLLSGQDDRIVMTGTPAQVEQHKVAFSYGLLEWIPKEEYPKVLDIGCGAGEVKALKEIGYDVTGITLGPMNIDYAKEVHDIEIVYGDMHDLPFPEGSFDAVITKHSFEHCFAPILVTLEIWRVLNGGGRWVLQQPDATTEGGFNWAHPSVLSAEQRRCLFTNFCFSILHNTESETVSERVSEEQIRKAPESPYQVQALGLYALMRQAEQAQGGRE